MASSAEHFGQVLLQIERDLGTRDACENFLECFKDALRLTKFKSADDVRSQVKEFCAMFVDVKPRMAIVQNYLNDVLEMILETEDCQCEDLVERVIAEVNEAEEDGHARASRLNRHAVSLLPQEGKVLVHSNSHTVLDAVCEARRMGKRFEVVVAEQDAEYTLDVIHRLQAGKVPFTVVPEYMLSYLEDDICCAVIGAVTLKADYVLAVHAGTKAVVSEMNTAKIPVYLLLTTNKFSFWKSQSAPQTVKTVKTLHHERGGFLYDRIKFSHDRLPLEQVDKIVTEDGVFDGEGLKGAFEKLLDEYEELVKEFPQLKRKAPKRRMKHDRP